MADEADDQKPDPTTETREPASERRTEERREEPKAERAAAPEPPEPRVDCPDCALDVRQSQLAVHRWKAHQIDRREAKGEPDKKERATRERKPAPPPPDGGEKDEPEPVASRWADVRKGW